MSSQKRKLARSHLAPAVSVRLAFPPLEGGRYHYLDEGHGSPLLLVHGNPTWSFHWRNLITELRGASSARRPGSHRLRAERQAARIIDYRLASHIDNLSRLVAELDLRDATLVAQDWGGAIGLGAVLRMPERFRRMVLFNTAAFRSRRRCRGEFASAARPAWGRCWCGG